MHQIRAGRALLATAVLAGLFATSASAASPEDALVLRTVQSPPNPVPVNQVVTYTITLTNTGGQEYPPPEDAQRGIPPVFMSMFLSRYRQDSAPPNNFTSVTPSQGTCTKQPTRPPSVDCNFGTLGPGATVTWVAVVVGKVSMENRIALLQCSSSTSCGTIKIADADTIVQCVVPKLKGRTLVAAKTALTAANCKLGHVTRKKSAASKRGRVVAQKPAAGTKLASQAKVAITLGKG